jgi:LmbE family N-acetylglucosaminyl deacetylase
VSAVIFSPHNDDETLFAFYTMARNQAELVVVLRSMRQQRFQDGPTYQRRENETLCATRVAGVSYVQWIAFYDDDPPWELVAEFVGSYIDISRPELVIAPAWEEDGHEDHNALAEIVTDLSRSRQFEEVRYLTYRRGHGRSTEGEEVVPSPAERAQKAAALRCYASQRNHPPTRYWFEDGDQREFVLC